MTTRAIAVVSAGLSEPSSSRLLADLLADATAAQLRASGDEVEVEVLELRELAHDLTNHLLTNFASGPLRRAKTAVAEADGLIAVTPIFSGSYNGLFKTFFDVLDPDALLDCPVLIGATAGTARHSLALDYALRPLFAYLKAVIVPTGVLAATDDWGAHDQATTRLAGRVQRAGSQLAALVSADLRQRADDPFAHPVPFEELLKGAEG